MVLRHNESICTNEETFLKSFLLRTNFFPLNNNEFIKWNHYRRLWKLING